MTGPGDLDRRLTLEASEETTDDQGGLVRVFVPVTDLWAQVVPQRGRVNFAADAPGAYVTHRIIVRDKFVITLRHRLREDDTIYRIVSKRRIHDGRYLEIDVEERVE